MPNNHYKLITQHAPFGYAYHQIIYNETGEAVDYKFIEVNTAFEELTGLKGGDIVGKTVTEILPKTVTDCTNWIKYYSNISHRGSKAEFTKYSPVLKRWCKINIFSPAKGYFVMLITDITKEKSVEQELTERLTELEKFFALLPDLLCIGDTDGYLHKINHAWHKLLGYSNEELLTNKYTKFLHPMDSRKTSIILKKLARRKKVIDFVNRYRCADGSYRHLSWRAAAHGKKVYAVARDITNLKAAKERIEANERLLKVTLHSIGDGVITTDASGKILMLNSTAAELTGWHAKEAVGQHFSKVFNLVHQADRQQYFSDADLVLKSCKVKELFKNTLLISKKQQERFVEGSASCIKNQLRDILGLVLIFRDVTEEQQRAQEITYLSYYDKLTGLYNRAFFEEQLKRLDQPRQLPLSLIMGDVNGLKLTNDVFGHEQGDQLLIRIAKILKECCRAEDVVARWGGDEFVILLPQTPNKTAEKICRRIKEACDEASSNTIQLSIALGCATKIKDTDDIMQVLKKAEDYMYKNKLLISKSLRSSIVASIQKTMYEKSHESEAHAHRLGQYCKEIGYLLGLPENEINDLELLALLHDIGVVVVKDNILNKDGPLTEDEWLEIKKHPEVGYRIAQSVPELASIAEYILTHHERWDGQGYPQGLKGEDIPMLSRILSVVDAYDAMIHHRAHRATLTKDEAVEELLANAGTQFDPDIVDIFVKKVLLG